MNLLLDILFFLFYFLLVSGIQSNIVVRHLHNKQCDNMNNSTTQPNTVHNI